MHRRAAHTHQEFYYVRAPPATVNRLVVQKDVRGCRLKLRPWQEEPLALADEGCVVAAVAMDIDRRTRSCAACTTGGFSASMALRTEVLVAGTMATNHARSSYPHRNFCFGSASAAGDRTPLEGTYSLTKPLRC